MTGTQSRTQKAKLNMLFSLLQQGVSLVCGLILPKLMIGAFGSEAYGAIGSITTFLAYITLLEGGLGAVTRSALYRAFASKSDGQVDSVIAETRRLYRRIALVFILYVLAVAFGFKGISHNETFDYWYSFALVIVIALSTFAEYFIGITYSLLLQADQRNYIPSLFRIVTTILNTAGSVLLISLGCDLLTVRLLTALILALRPVLLAVYVKKRYRLKPAAGTTKYLTQKSAAIGQHIAWTLHNNTDVTVLTVFRGLTYVSVYSVYNMVVSQMQNLLGAFTAGMEAVFGNMYAAGERDNLQKTFGYYETLISLLSVVAFTTAAVMIVPFVTIYTRGITDAEYIHPVFGVTLLSAALLYCLRSPYGHMIIAAGHFRQTQAAAYGETVINIAVSVALVLRMGLTGVAVGTVAATLFRFVYYVRYLSRRILERPARLWVRRMLVNAASCALIFAAGSFLVGQARIDDYRMWAAVSLAVFAGAGAVAFAVNWVFYRNDLTVILRKGFGRIRGGK